MTRFVVETVFRMVDVSGWRRSVVCSVVLAATSLTGQMPAAQAADLPSLLAPPVFASPPPLYPNVGRFTLVEENDFLFFAKGSDQHYTQGAVLSYLSPMLSGQDVASQFYNGISSVLPIFQDGPGVGRKFDVVFGQSIFTPRVYRTFPLDPRDRPFAGWLYTGGSLLQETDGKMLENFELLAGVVGPDSLADVTQQDFHDLIGFNNKQLAQTWKTQIKNEPGFALTYERKWRMWQSSLFGFETEVVPEVGITAGNVLTYGEGGVTFRIGRDLGVDYGPLHARPSLSGTPWFDANRLVDPWGWYLFAGLQGRAVARNIFLDGNTFENSRSVDKEILVGDASVGGSWFYKDIFKVDLTFSVRSKEFKTQAYPDHFPDRVGQLGVSWRY